MERYQDRVEQKQEFEARFPEGAVRAPGRQRITTGRFGREQPPTSAYEDAPAPDRKVGNINLDRLEPGRCRSAHRAGPAKVGGFDEARRWCVTNG
jgi:hypothetical protein